MKRICKGFILVSALSSSFSCKSIPSQNKESAEPQEAKTEAESDQALSLGTASPTITLDKQGRDGNRYVLYSNGDFFRIITSLGNLKCQITTNVVDFKMSFHKQDKAIAYYIRKETSTTSSATLQNLYFLRPDIGLVGNCPKTSKEKLLEDIKVVSGALKYTVVSNTSEAVNTLIVNMALSNASSGYTDLLKGWENDKANFIQQKVLDYQMNECFGVSGKSFNNYVAFSMQASSVPAKFYIWKLHGSDPVGQSKVDTQLWASFQAFKDYYKVCGKAN